jgi:hypothetical protein
VRDISLGASADYDDNTATAAAAAARCFPEPDPLALELCACEGPPAWVDTMLKELAASLVVSPSVGALVPRCSPAPVVAF